VVVGHGGREAVVRAGFYCHHGDRDKIPGGGTGPPAGGATLPPRLLLDVVVEADDVGAVTEGLEEASRLLPRPLRQRHPVPGQVLDGGRQRAQPRGLQTLPHGLQGGGLADELRRTANSSWGWSRGGQWLRGTVRSAGDNQWWSGMVLSGEGMAKSNQEVTKGGWGQSSVVQGGLGWLEVANSTRGMAKSGHRGSEMASSGQGTADSA